MYQEYITYQRYYKAIRLKHTQLVDMTRIVCLIPADIQASSCLIDGIKLEREYTHHRDNNYTCTHFMLQCALHAHTILWMFAARSH